MRISVRYGRISAALRDCGMGNDSRTTNHEPRKSSVAERTQIRANAMLPTGCGQMTRRRLSGHACGESEGAVMDSDERR